MGPLPKLCPGKLRGVMGWFRTNVRFGSRLALLALALQLLVSFSHVHLGDLSIVSAPSDSIALPDQPDDVFPKPPQQSHDPLCAICVLIQLASSSVHAVAPALDLPHWLEWAQPKTLIALPHPALVRLSFSARAPPFD
jgi:hypothetical protein